ncbi:MAG: chemotaxis-specific protein-glutamate methyltransferase CheB [Pseudomonadota bacterium]
MARILVVDDSALMRRLLVQVLEGAGYEVKTARTGAEAVSELMAWLPDAITLDINMPEMDGLTALSLIMSARPTPVVMVSSLTEQGALATFEALALGAVDFITKPGGTISLTIDDIKGQLLEKIKAALRSRATLSGKRRPLGAVRPPIPAPAPAPKAPAARPAVLGTAGVVIIGVSTGGPRTLEDILPPLPLSFPWPIVVAQHMPPNFTNAFAQRMDRLCNLRVREVTAPCPLEPGNVYIGRGGGDVVIAERLGRPTVMPKPETPGHPWHPSVDVLVESAMKLYKPEKMIGVLLTGMGNDGADQMTRMHRQGSRTIAESQSSCVVFGMPHELIQMGGASVVLPSTDIAGQLQSWLG